MFKKIKKWWKRKMWDYTMKECRKMRKNPEKYDINKMLGIKPPKKGEIEQLKKILEEYEKRIESDNE